MTERMPISDRALIDRGLLEPSRPGLPSATRSGGANAPRACSSNCPGLLSVSTLAHSEPSFFFGDSIWSSVEIRVLAYFHLSFGHKKSWSRASKRGFPALVADVLLASPCRAKEHGFRRRREADGLTAIERASDFAPADQRTVSACFAIHPKRNA